MLLKTPQKPPALLLPFTWLMLDTKRRQNKSGLPVPDRCWTGIAVCSLHLFRNGAAELIPTRLEIHEGATSGTLRAPGRSEAEQWLCCHQCREPKNNHLFLMRVKTQCKYGSKNVFKHWKSLSARTLCCEHLFWSDTVLCHLDFYMAIWC